MSSGWNAFSASTSIGTGIVTPRPHMRYSVAIVAPPRRLMWLGVPPLTKAILRRGSAGSLPVIAQWRNHCAATPDQPGRS